MKLRPPKVPDPGAFSQGLTPPPAGGETLLSVYEANPSEARPPCSNTGVNQVAALVDYASVSTPLASLSDSCGPVSALLPRTEADLRNATESVRFQVRNLAQILFNRVFPGTAIEARPFAKKGFLGYVYSATLHVEGVEGQVGMIACGGNGNTLHISLTGAGCAWIRDWYPVAENLAALRSVITRADLAVDDVKGEFLTVQRVARAARNGEFKGKGAAPCMRLIDDLGTRKGKTLYVGSKGSKELCCYEKGMQLGDKNSKWVRAEVRLWSKNRAIPYDALTNPGAYVRGEYPALAKFLPREPAKRSHVMRATADATIEAAERWVTHTAGKTLDFLRRAAEQADAHPADLINSLSRDGMPRRFAGVPEAVAFARAAPRMREPSSVFDLPEVEREDSTRLSYEFEGATA